MRATKHSARTDFQFWLSSDYQLSDRILLPCYTNLSSEMCICDACIHDACMYVCMYACMYVFDTYEIKLSRRLILDRLPRHICETSFVINDIADKPTIYITTSFHVRIIQVDDKGHGHKVYNTDPTL